LKEKLSKMKLAHSYIYITSDGNLYSTVIAIFLTFLVYRISHRVLQKVDLKAPSYESKINTFRIVHFHCFFFKHNSGDFQVQSRLNIIFAIK
jgi:hypothetical protein